MLIYKITNKYNNKAYIGQTICATPDNRWRNHCKPSRKSAISFAIQKYGKENFIFEVIEKCNSLEDLNIRESYHIATDNTMAPHGYNLREGGNNSRMSDSAKKKLSEARKGAKNWWYGKKNTISEETRRKISKTKTGKPNPSASIRMTGKTKYNCEYVAKMAEKLSFKYKGSGNPNSKEVIVNNKLYKTMKEASVDTGISMYKLRKYYLK